jgi:uncharacterized protein with HEPN domain
LSTRRDSSFLKDILVACGKVEAIVASAPEAKFLSDEVLQAAVLHHLTVIGEAVHQLTPALRERNPEVPWQPIVSVRHRIVHAYFDLDWQILWGAATEDIPRLRSQVAEILRKELPGEEWPIRE